MIQLEKKETYTYEYPRPSVTTDCVIFGYDQGELKVLLIERSIDPFVGKWALPGGFVGEDETAEDCARRILSKEACLDNIFMEQLFTFSQIDRDPRFRVISIAYYALVKLSDYEAKAGMDASNVNWFSLADIPDLAFDHNDILNKAIDRVKGKIRYQPLGFELLPQKFTLPDLRQLYEVILEANLDDRNFRKKILSFDLLKDTGEKQKGARNRAPKLYQFDEQKYDELTRKGFYFEL